MVNGEFLVAAFVVGEDFFGEGEAEVFAAGALGGLAGEVGMGLELAEEGEIEGALGGEAAVFVVTVFAVGGEGDDGVEEHVSGAGVEGEDGRVVSGQWPVVSRSGEGFSFLTTGH